jgi:hypothetical protein
MQKPAHPNRADVKLAVLKLMLLPDNEADFTKDDYEFLKSDLCGKILKFWPDGALGVTVSRKPL